MKQIIKYCLFVFMLSFFCLLNSDLVKADYERIVNGAVPCKLYEDKTGNNATGSCIYANTKFNSYVSTVVWVDNGDKVTVLTDYSPITPPTSGYGSECKSNFYYIKNVYNSKTYYGYVCGDVIQAVELTDTLKQEFIENGFTEEYSSYWDELAALKTNHPTWTFIAIDTELKFSTVIDNQDSGAKSLYQSTSSSTQGYLSTAEGNYDWDKDKFTVYDGSTWYAANYDTIAYYVDPRNFLSDMYIFQFETLAYESKLHTLEGLQSVLGDAYIAKFADYFMEAAQKHNVNPIYLASLSLQEVGHEKSTAISGEEFTYNGETYSNLYNFYNIGATSGTEPVYNGLYYASKNSTYGRPWDTEQKAIVGGAEFIASSYIKYGQDTSYFKKWNVIANYRKKNELSYHNNYTHQYMTNVRAPSSEAVSTYRSLAANDELEKDYVFYIPVYDNMPESTSLPAKGNPNNRLKDIKIDGTIIDNYESSDFEYELFVGNEKSSIVLTATTINANATVTGTGTIKLDVGENTLDLVVKAQNGNQQTYKLIVNRAPANGDISYLPVEEILDKAQKTYAEGYISNLTLTTKISDYIASLYEVSPTVKTEVKRDGKVITSGEFRTGDEITITSGEDIKSYKVVIYGDVSGDGKHNVLDLLKIQKHILKTSIVSGAYLEAADVNKDNKVNIQDIVRLQKAILGTAYISQK